MQTSVLLVLFFARSYTYGAGRQASHHLLKQAIFPSESYEESQNIPSSNLEGQQATPGQAPVEDRGTGGGFQEKQAGSANAEVCYKLGLALLSEKKYAAAIYDFKQVLASNPPQTLSYQLEAALAEAYGEIRDFRAAVDVLLNLVAANPGSPEAHFELATAYAHNEQYREAASEYEKCLRLDPGNDVAQLSLAKALVMVGQFEGALPWVEKYLRRHPRDYDGYFVQGRAYKWLHKFAEASDALQRAAQLRPDDSEIRYNLGLVLARLRKRDPAIEQLKRAETLDPGKPEIRFELARLWREKGDDQQAQQEEQEFRLLRQQSEQRDRAQALANQGNELLKKGDAHGAVENYHEALKLTPGDATIHFDLSLALSKLGNRQAEQSELERTIGLKPEFAAAHNRLGLVYMAEGNGARAEGEFQSAIRISPELAEALNNLGVLYDRQGRDTEAIGMLRQAAEEFRLEPQGGPGFANAAHNLARLLIAQKRYAAAISYLQDALKSNPPAELSAQLQVALGVAYAESGDSDRAIATLRQAIKSHPDLTEAHFNLAALYAKEGPSLGYQLAIYRIGVCP